MAGLSSSFIRPPTPGAARRLSWPAGGGSVLASSPLSLAPYANMAVELDVPVGCVALVIDHHRVAGLLLPDRHRLRVIDAGSPATPEVRPGERPLASTIALLLLSKDRLLTLAWSPSGALRRTGATRGPAALGGGRASMRIGSPVRFYRAFLRRTEDLGEVRLRRVVAALLQSRLEAGEAGSPQNLAVEAPARTAALRRRMARLGLQLIELELESAEPATAAVPEVAPTHPAQ